MSCEDEPNPDKPPECSSPPDQPRPAPPPPHDMDTPDDSRCKRLAKEVNAQLLKQSKLHNSMDRLEGKVQELQAIPLDIPKIKPWVEIRWGNSNCDCIESDDTEIMYLTVGNPYSNLTLTDLTIQKITLLQGENQPIPKLPNGNPCIDVTPLGPYYFGDIPPEGKVTRQLVMWLRGALGGDHRLLLHGICFNASVHGDNDATFKFHVCED